MVNKVELKKLINTLADVTVSSAESIGVENADEIAKFELARFMMYLSASDGEIQWTEASMISDLCDLNLTPQTVSTFIKENNIYSTEFEQTAPLTLQMIVTADNRLINHELGKDSPDILKIVVDTYRYAAALLIGADGDVDANEEADCHIYIDMMEKYIAENSDRRKMSVSGITKNTGNVSAPTKSGVSAPRKKE